MYRENEGGGRGREREGRKRERGIERERKREREIMTDRERERVLLGSSTCKTVLVKPSLKILPALHQNSLIARPVLPSPMLRSFVFNI